MRERAGHRGIPYAMEHALRALPVAQRSVLVSLAFEATYGEPTVEVVRGVAVAVEIGEALVSYESLAARLRLGAGAKGVSLVRRAIASGVRIGLISVRRAIPAGDTPAGDTPAGDTPRDTPRDTGPDTYHGTPYGTPPTIVRFLRHREILWPPEKRSTPHDTPGYTCGGTPGDTGDSTIPQSIEPESTEQRLPRASEKWPCSTALAAALSDRWQTTVVLPGMRRRDEVEAAVASLGPDAALAECIADAGNAYGARRINNEPGSLGFFAERLITAARRAKP